MNKKIYGGCSDGLSPVKRVAAIHDLSCFGRCALTVIIPVLSTMGIQVVPVPTCLLSSHTGGFTDMHFEDLEPSMHKIADHFERLGLRFDAIYTGFLGSASQISEVRSFIDRFADENTLVLVDPVMGDDGELYSTYTPELMRGMSELCRGADIITPNLTEACFLTDTPYCDTDLLSENELKEFTATLCKKLEITGARQIVITGIPNKDNKLYVCGDGENENGASLYGFERVRKNYPGTGDLFACVLLGCMLRGDALSDAISTAANFTRRVMEYSAQFETPEREGVALEAFLGELAFRRGEL